MIDLLPLDLFSLGIVERLKISFWILIGRPQAFNCASGAGLKIKNRPVSGVRI